MRRPEKAKKSNHLSTHKRSPQRPARTRSSDRGEATGNGTITNVTGKKLFCEVKRKKLH